MMAASKNKDDETLELCKKIALVPEHIKYACLGKYVQKCMDLHRIAFIQWRYLFPNKLTY